MYKMVPAGKNNSSTILKYIYTQVCKHARTHTHKGWLMRSLLPWSIQSEIINIHVNQKQ